MSDAVKTAVPQTPPAPQPAPPRPASVRRVGTLTLGVALIIVGLSLCAYMIWPSFNIILVMKFVPVLLVILGLELLYYNAKYKAERVRYDFMSTFLCAIIFLGAFGCVFAAKYAELGWGADGAERRMSTEWEQNLTEALTGNDGVASLYANAYYQDKWQLTRAGAIPDTLEGAQKNDLAVRGHVNVTLTGTYESKAEFLAACDKLRSVIASCGVEEPDISFSTAPASETNPVSYFVSTGGAFEYSRPMTELSEDSVGEEVWQPETEPVPEAGTDPTATAEYAEG